MQLKVCDEKGIVEVWVTNSEKNDPAVQAELKEVYAKYSASYTVVVFQSGSSDLYKSTRELLLNNKRKGVRTRCTERICSK